MKKKAHTKRMEEKYPDVARVQGLAFLFRRDIAKILRREGELILASTIHSAIVGTNVGYSIDTLTANFHPDMQQRRDAAQRLLDDMEFRFDSDIRKLEFAGDLTTAALARKQKDQLRAHFEQQVGKLAHRETIDAARPGAAVSTQQDGQE